MGPDSPFKRAFDFDAELAMKNTSNPIMPSNIIMEVMRSDVILIIEFHFGMQWSFSPIEKIPRTPAAVYPTYINKEKIKNKYGLDLK